MICCRGNCLNFVSKGGTVHLQPKSSAGTQSAQYKIGDQTVYNLTKKMALQCHYLLLTENQKRLALDKVIMLTHAQKGNEFFKEPVTGTMKLLHSNRDQASFAALPLHPSLPPAAPLYTLLHLSSLPPFHFPSSHTDTLCHTLHFHQTPLMVLHSTCGLHGR